ncbi:MAG: hypothetical protein P1U81_18785 [Verrucomicrobiales bacterium]|jgi:chromosome segregation ATPase|nr:hypothetical protein [Verrucomicrobiales bacterium]
MIRIPFSSDSETSQPGDSSARQEKLASLGGSRHSLEERMEKLESRLEVHSSDLKDRVTERVERIESRIHRAMTSLSGVTEDESAENVIEFAAEAKSMHHLPTTSAISALNELNSTLRQTREHLDALRASVEQMRRSVPRTREKESA